MRNVDFLDEKHHKVLHSLYKKNFNTVRKMDNLSPEYDSLIGLAFVQSLFYWSIPNKEKLDPIKEDMINISNELKGYGNHPCFIFFEIKKIIKFMECEEFSFDNSKNDIMDFNQALYNDNIAEIIKTHDNLDQYTRSFFSEEFYIYLRYLIKQ